jgi:hypothetical protein
LTAPIEAGPRKHFATAKTERWSYRVNAAEGSTDLPREATMPSEAMEAMAVFGFLAVGAIALFTMISISSWSSSRQKEREAYYKNDMLKKVAEAQGPGAASALELLREENKIYAQRTKQGLKIGGLVCIAIGIGVLVFLKALVTDEPVYLSGLIVLLIGAALYGGSYVVTVPAEEASK